MLKFILWLIGAGETSAADSGDNIVWGT